MASVVRCEPVKPELAPERVAVPRDVGQPHRREQPRSQHLGDADPGEPPHDDGQQVGRHLVVGEDRARRPGGLRREDPRHPVGRVVEVAPAHPVEDLRPGILLVPDRHGEAVPDLHVVPAGGDDTAVQLREVVEHAVVERQAPLLHEEAHGRGRHRLRERVREMDAVGGIRPPPALGHDVPVAHDHEAVQSEVVALGGVDEREDAGRRRRPAPTGCCGEGSRARGYAPAVRRWASAVRRSRRGGRMPPRQPRGQPCLRRRP